MTDGGEVIEADEDSRPVTGQGGVAGLLARVCFFIGAAALLIAMCCDALAVVGRHAGVPLLGSIEIVQACVVVAASAAMVGATVSRGHAAVHILLERVSEKAAARIHRLANLAGAVVTLALLAGSLWIVSDLWGGRERTELLKLPLLPLRLFWCASAGLMAALFLIRLVRGERRGGSRGV
jgi:TRAP-type C4-dicarboxylate transport system permease small subunit